MSIFTSVDDFESVEEKVLYGAEDNSTFLECVPRSPQASVQWFVQRPPDEQRDEVRLLPCLLCSPQKGQEAGPRSPSQPRDHQQVKTDERILQTDQGLLFRRLHRHDAGIYYCKTLEHGFTQTVAKTALEVITSEQLAHTLPRERGHKSPYLSCPELWLTPQVPKTWYKDIMHLISSQNLRRVEEYCARLWCGSSRPHHRKRKMAQGKHVLGSVDVGKKAQIAKPRGERNRVPRQAAAT